MSKQPIERLSPKHSQLLFKGSLAVAALGILGSFFLYFADTHRFFFSYLTSFMFFLTMSLGALFFVMIQHITRTGWSVVMRRVPEHMMKNLWVMAFLFIPILFGMSELYHWTHADAVAHDHLLQGKSPYLNVPFFLIRAVFFWGIWMLLSHLFFNGSTSQDKTGDKSITLRHQKLSTVGILLFAVTVTFAAIDWAMSITPHWFSTMFGVYIFAGSMFSFYAMNSLLHLSLRRLGYLRKIVSIDHFQDAGKLFFGFTVFWAYISFSQYFLIWYANMPEETHWFKEHFHGTWNSVAAFLAIGHFAVPFLLFMSKWVKRNMPAHCLMVIWALFMHYVDLYWLIMPNVNPHGVHPALVDATTFLAIGGIYVAALVRRASSYDLYPTSDPRLSESLHFENV